MKEIKTFIFIGLIILGTSCKKYLDINTNPNSATSTTPELVLPQALTTTASVLNTFNSYGAEMGAYAANAGGYGGFGEAVTYNFSSSTWNGLWTSTYDNLEDYQYILNNSGTVEYSYYNAAARIMKAYDFELLVDTYNDVPYSKALTGDDNLTPGYDKGPAIYLSLANQLDSAIKTINSANSLAAAGTNILKMGSSDVLFKGDVTKWLQFANTIKLRLLVRGNGKVNFTNTTFDVAGFLNADALINPGYTQDNGKQNPEWNSWAFTYTGGAATKSWVPSTFIFGFYDGHTLIDSARGRAIYFTFNDSLSKAITNRLGYENVSVAKSPLGSFWYSGTDRTVSAGTTNHVGVLKGANTGFPAMTAAESYFLQSEAVVRGLLTSDSTAKALFTNGIIASFKYLYLLPDNSVSGSPKDSAAAYFAKNTSSYLVNFDLATTTDKKIEAIITQKYIAMNFVNSQEGWNEYRRTLYPTTVPSGNGYQTFASTASESSRADKLPARVMYPTTEYAYNPANVPPSISPFTSLIFWAK